MSTNLPQLSLVVSGRAIALDGTVWTCSMAQKAGTEIEVKLTSADLLLHTYRHKIKVVHGMHVCGYHGRSVEFS